MRKQPVMETTTAGGMKTRVRHMVKDEHYMTFWYLVQFPCGGWWEFDMRWLTTEAGISLIEKSVAERLAMAAALIKDVDIFAIIREKELAMAHLMKKCARCKLGYEIAAERHCKDGSILLVCPRCGCRWTIVPSAPPEFGRRVKKMAKSEMTSANNYKR